MDAATRQLIEALHRDVPYRYVLAVTGGGSGAAALLLGVPGGSRTVLEAIVPYGEQALADFLGEHPEQFCSAATSRAMAQRALQRARWLAPAQLVAGVGCTASLATDRPKRGEHRFHISVATSSCAGSTVSLVLAKGMRDREGEEAVLDAVLLNTLAGQFGIPQRLAVPLLPGEELQTEHAERSRLAALIDKDAAPPTLCVEGDGRHRVGGETPRALLPGAFNPAHAGHWQLAATAAQRLGCPVAFELSVLNVDKASLGIEELRQRLAQFAWHAPVWVTRAPMFTEKARLFPGAVFVIGADTAARIVAPRYYPDGQAGVREALALFRERGCRFLVACRVDASGRCVHLEETDVPSEGRELFQPLPESEFRIDISSTYLREHAHVPGEVS